MITIADTGGANFNSVVNALKWIGVEYKFANTKEDLARAEKILLPGVGAAREAMQRLENQGVVDTLRNIKVPVLGICLGMQLLYESSDEGDVECLGVIPGKVVSIKNTGLSLPHMGWNKIMIEKGGIFDFCDGEYVYFVHSFRADMNEHVQLYTNYGEEIPALVQKDNFYGAQFHPEKSADIGEKILKRFIEI